VAVSRLLTFLASEGTLPVGEEVWGSGVIVLPEGAPARWRNVLTGAEVRAVWGRVETGRTTGEVALAGMTGSPERVSTDLSQSGEAGSGALPGASAETSTGGHGSTVGAQARPTLPRCGVPAGGRLLLADVFAELPLALLEGI
jgi:hypothetical protein